MNSKLTGIIVVSVLAASMGGVLLLLNHTGGGESSSADESSSQSAVINARNNKKTQIVDRSADDVASVYVKNQYDEYTMERNTSGKTLWNIDALEGLSLSVSEENALADCAATLMSFDTVEEDAQELTKYGFDDPTATFTVTFTDGESRTFYIGGFLPGGERYYYVHEEGDNTVYQVVKTYVEGMTEPKEEYVTKTLIIAPGNDKYPDYGTLTVSRKDLDYNIVLVNDDSEQGAVSAQVMVEPVYGYLNISNSTTFSHGMWGLTATTAEKIHPDENDLKEYGIDDPTAVVTLVGEGYDYTLKIGNAVHVKDENGEDKDEIASYYCTLEGVSGLDCIFLIPASSLPWATYLPQDIISSLMTFNYIQDVSEIVITKPSGTDTIKLTVDEAAEDVTAAELNGKSLDVPSFKTFYEYLLTCPTSEVYFTEPESDSVMKIEIKRRDGGGDTLEFFGDTGRRTVVKLNGITSYRIESKWITQFEKNIESLEQGKTIGESY